MKRARRSKDARYIYGRHPVSEALRTSPRDVVRLYIADAGKSTRLSDIVQRAERHNIPVVGVAKRTLVDLVGDVPHQGVVAGVAPFAYADLTDLLEVATKADEAPLLVALDHIQDPHNLGAVARSVFAQGGHGVIIPKDRACEVTPAAMKTSAGAISHIGVAQVTNLRRALDELKAAGLWIVGTLAADEGAQPIDTIDFLQPTVIVIGSEEKGMRRTIIDGCDLLAHVPMAGDLGSLNASAAASICVYEAVRQRRLS